MHLMTRNTEIEKKLIELQEKLDENAKIAENAATASAAASITLNDDAKLHKAQIEELNAEAERKISKLREQFSKEKENLLALAKVAAEEAAAAEKTAMLEYKKDNIPAPPEEYADQVNAINKELSEEKKSSKITRERLDEITHQNLEKEEMLIESDKEANRQRKVSLEKERHYAKILEEQKTINQIASIEGLQMQSVINQLKLELANAEGILAMTNQNAEWQEKANLNMKNKTLDVEQEALDATRRLKELTLASQTDKERLQTQSSELQKYKEKIDNCMKATEGHSDYSRWPEIMWRRMQEISGTIHIDPTFEAER